MRRCGEACSTLTKFDSGTGGPRSTTGGPKRGRDASPIELSSDPHRVHASLAARTSAHLRRAPRQPTGACSTHQLGIADARPRQVEADGAGLARTRSAAVGDGAHHLCGRAALVRGHVEVGYGPNGARSEGLSSTPRTRQHSTKASRFGKPRPPQSNTTMLVCTWRGRAWTSRHGALGREQVALAWSSASRSTLVASAYEPAPRGCRPAHRTAGHAPVPVGACDGLP